MLQFFLYAAGLAGSALAGPAAANQSFHLTSALDVAVVPTPLYLDAGAPPAMTIDLKPILNRQWSEALKIGGLLSLSGQFDRSGNPYVAVLLPGSESPKFFYLRYNFPFGGLGSIEKNGTGFSLWISPTSTIDEKNHLVIRQNGVGPIYDNPIRDLMVATVESGFPVRIKDRDYRLFYSNDINMASGDPAFATQNKVVGLVHEYFLEGRHKFKLYIIAKDLILGRKPVWFQLFDGQPVGLSIDPADDILDIYDTLARSSLVAPLPITPAAIGRARGP